MNQEKYKKIFESEETRKYAQSICELAKEELEKSFKSKDGEVAKLKFIHFDQLKEFVKKLPNKDAIKFAIAKIYE